MSARDDKVMRRNLQSITIATVVILLAVAVIIIGATDEGWRVALCAVLLGAGIMLTVTGALFPSSGTYGPSYSDVRMVTGILIAMLGIIGLVNVYVNSEWWVSLALLLLTVAILMLVMTMKGMIKIKR